MADFGENYKGGKDAKLCPLCRKHEDTQEASFKECEIIKAEVKPSRNYTELFNNEIEKEFVHILKKIEEVREKVEK